MGWLSNWLKELIMIILLATFIDLLLPSQVMQRYVRTVIGLFLLMILLSPVFEIFQKNWNADKLLQAAEGLQIDLGQTEPEVQSLSTIMQESDKLENSQQQQAKDLVEIQLAASIKEGLQTKAELPVQSVSVVTTIDAKGKPAIANVRVTLLQQSKKQDTPAVSHTIEPIKPVMIRIEPESQTIAQNKTIQNGNSAKSRPEETLSLNQVKQYLLQEWLIKPEQIQVTF
jgi:stage III sporulation protein AF